MSHRDLKVAHRPLNADFLKASLNWLLRGTDWSPVAWRKDCSWSPRLLAVASLLWAWSDELTLVERFGSARRIALTLFPPQGEVAGSYQAFMKLLSRWTAAFRTLLIQTLRGRMTSELPGCWQVLDFVMFGVDGSRAELPRTLSNERAYAPARHQPKRRTGKRKSRAGVKKTHTPQLWLTTMWHVATGLPWDWCIGPSDSSERAHLLEMLPGLPSAALIVADAGFVGYEYATAVIHSGRHFLLRVGANVRLLKRLAYARENDGTVYLWPDKAARRQQSPLVLRLVVSHNGKHPVYLLTSVISTSRLSDRQVVELYSRRWGIEVFYRNLKQTFSRRKLRSASAEPARVELEWSLLGLWAMSLYALVKIRCQDIAPRRLSCAKLLRAFRRALRDYLHPVERGQTLSDCLRRSVIDDYQRRNKTSRDYPRKKQETPAGKPCILRATASQIRLAQSLRAAA